jgi:N-acetylglucosamine-6-phosphate deacetylase
MILLAAGLYSSDETPGPVAVVVRSGLIAARWQEDDPLALVARCGQMWSDESIAIEDLRPLWLAPGLIDLHIHGYHGYDANTGDEDALAALARALPATGVTAFLPTIASASPEVTARQAVRIAAAASRGEPGAARILGMRLEGPWINPLAAGAQDPTAIRPPDIRECERLVTLASGMLRIVDFAPEMDQDGALLAALRRLDILPSIGHTAATFERALEAIEGGARHCAHLFNAMPSLHHRAPGAVGALLTDNRPTVEVIADGVHVHPALLRLVVQARRSDHVALVTDATAPAGLDEGVYAFAGRQVTLRDGAVRLSDGTLAGSALTLDAAVRRMVETGACRLTDALRMASATPARILGLANELGSLSVGSAADLIALDEHSHVRRAWIGGVPAAPVDDA